MPVEDVSVEWDEEVSKPIPIATLTIGVQDDDSTEGRASTEECETMAFSPRNALAEHRPMGEYADCAKRSIWPARQREYQRACCELLR
jgi:hypothetical protein